MGTSFNEFADGRGVVPFGRFSELLTPELLEEIQTARQDGYTWRVICDWLTEVYNIRCSIRGLAEAVERMSVD
jgi:hypothetical protein